MTDNNVPVVDKGDTGMAIIIYALYLASFVVGISSIVRCVKGIMWVQKGQEVPDPGSWMFGEAKK